MKTIKEMKVEIADIIHRIKNEVMKKGIESRLRKRIQFLHTCILYIETNPDKEYIAAQIKMVETKIELRMRGFDESQFKDWSKRDFSKMKKIYEKEYDIPKLKTQVSAMKFLIS